MAKTATIKLGEDEFTVHPFNLDELQELGDILSADDPASKRRAAYKIVLMGLRRSVPKPDDPGSLVATVPQITDAMVALMTLSSPPQEATPPVAN